MRESACSECAFRVFLVTCFAVFFLVGSSTLYAQPDGIPDALTPAEVKKLLDREKEIITRSRELMANSALSRAEKQEQMKRFGQEIREIRSKLSGQSKRNREKLENGVLRKYEMFFRLDPGLELIPVGATNHTLRDDPGIHELFYSLRICEVLGLDESAAEKIRGEATRLNRIWGESLRLATSTGNVGAFDNYRQAQKAFLGLLKKELSPGQLKKLDRIVVRCRLNQQGFGSLVNELAKNNGLTAQEVDRITILCKTDDPIPESDCWISRWQSVDGKPDGIGDIPSASGICSEGRDVTKGLCRKCSAKDNYTLKQSLEMARRSVKARNYWPFWCENPGPAL